jgi:HD-GYP domain-containing protein (c-di-GMP phosphodiesterase class II)
MVETRDPYTAGHQRRVSDLARAIAQEAGMKSDEVDSIRIAGMIHDVGKISVPAEILSKPVRLSKIEINLIRIHPQAGFDILKDIEFPWAIGQIILQHHERMDGSGYPRGLMGDQVCFEARILAVADVVEAMASHRPYRPGLGLEAAFNEISVNQGRLYDEEVVKTCLSVFAGGYDLPVM